VKLARREEREVLAEFGETYRRYMITPPAFFPRLGGRVKTRHAQNSAQLTSETECSLAWQLDRITFLDEFKKRLKFFLR
jgi:hypothetical protein